MASWPQIWEGLGTYSCHEGGLPAAWFHRDLSAGVWWEQSHAFRMAVRGEPGLPAPGRGQPQSPLLAPSGGSCSPQSCLWPFSSPRELGLISLLKADTDLVARVAPLC